MVSVSATSSVVVAGMVVVGGSGRSNNNCTESRVNDSNSATASDMQRIEDDNSLEGDEPFTMPADLRPAGVKKRYLRSLQLAPMPMISDQNDGFGGEDTSTTGSELDDSTGQPGASRQQRSLLVRSCAQETTSMGRESYGSAGNPSSRPSSPLCSSRSPRLTARDDSSLESLDTDPVVPALALSTVNRQSQKSNNGCTHTGNGLAVGILQRNASSKALLPSQKFEAPSQANVDDVLRDPNRLQSLYFGKNAKREFFRQYRNLYSRPYLFMEDLEATEEHDLADPDDPERAFLQEAERQATTPKSSIGDITGGARESLLSSRSPLISRKASTTTDVPPRRKFSSNFAPMQQLPSQTTRAVNSLTKASLKTSSSTEQTPLTTCCEEFFRDELLVTPPIPQLSPRTAFLTMCVSKNSLALPFFLRKSFDSSALKVFDFSFQSLGDQVIMEFANLLCQMTQVEQLSVRDNRLSDHGLHFLLERIVQLAQGIFPDQLQRCVSMSSNSMPSRLSLRLLDVSQNEIGPKSAHTLRTFIALGATETNSRSRAQLNIGSGPNTIRDGSGGANNTSNTARPPQTMPLPTSTLGHCCTLRELLVENADIDDWECRSFMVSLGNNKSVRRLGMSRNLIGKAENLNVVKPDFVTGGEAIAQMLQTNYHLLRLDLSWNYLRLESAHSLAKSIELNSTLTELNLAYNTCADDGALKFGQLLRANTSLHVLDLSYNSIGWKGAMGLASALRSNQTLRKLLLNGNRIGREGGRMLFFCLTQNQNPDGLRLELSGCDFSPAATSALRSAPTAAGSRILPSISGTSASTSMESKNDPAKPLSKDAHGANDVVYEPVYSSLQASSRIFNSKEPTGRYLLDLADPFDQMMAQELARLATFRKGCRFVKLEYRTKQATHAKAKPSNGKSFVTSAGFGAKKSLSLVKKVPPLRQAITSVTAEEASSILKASMEELTLDEDADGGIDKRQLMHVLNAIGLYPTFANLDQLVDVLHKYRKQVHEKHTVEEATKQVAAAVSTNAAVQGDLISDMEVNAPATDGAKNPNNSVVSRASTPAIIAPATGSEQLDPAAQPTDQPHDHVLKEQETQALDKLDEDEDGDDDGKADATEDLSQLLFEAAFSWLDRDHSGNIDANEIEQAFKLLGLSDVSEQEIHAVIGKYDVTGDGALECHEFVEFLKDRLAQQQAVYQWQAPTRAATGPSSHSVRARTGSGLGSLRGLTAAETSRELLRAAQAQPLPELIDSSTGRAWVIPDQGCLEIEFLFEREASVSLEDCHFQWISDFGLKQLISNLIPPSDSNTKQSDQQELFRVALEESEIFVSACQAWQLFDAYDHQFHRAKWLRLETIAMLIPQLLTSQDAQLFVSRVLATFEEKIELKGFMGSSFASFLGNPTTHYELDLSKPKDRVALCKIAEIAHFEKTFSRDNSLRDDTSQHGNWENFRNETLDGRKWILSTSFFYSLPSQGKLCFDYVSTTRPRKGTLPISQRRFDQVLREMDQEYHLFVHVLTQKETTQAQAHAQAAVATTTPSREEDTGECQRNGPGQLKRGSSASLASTLLRVASSKTLELDQSVPANQTRQATSGPKKSKSRDADQPTTTPMDEAAPPSKPPEQPQQQQPLDLPDETQHKGADEWQYASDQLELPDALAHLKKLMGGVNGILNGNPRLSACVSDATPGQRQVQKTREEINLKLALLETYFSDKFIDVNQATRLVQWFPSNLLGQASCARLLFARIVDLHMFYQLFDQLDRANQLALVKWLGYLNMMNPMAPERKYELDLSIWDEREMAKVLVELAVQEPGENWTNQSYRYALDEPCLPGWQLPVRWAKPENAKERDSGVSHSGFVTLEYYSGADRGCSPIWSLRKQLIKRVLCGTKLYL